MGSHSSTSPVEDSAPQATKMLSKLVVALLLVSLQLVLYSSPASGMGLCFGGYPACCRGGRNTCGPFCASCGRVGEFLRMMMMFGGIGPGTPDSFRTINPDPFSGAGRGKVPFPAQPQPVGDRGNRGQRPKRSLTFPL